MHVQCNKRIKKVFLKKNNLVVLGIIISVIMAIIVTIPLSRLNLSAKTIYCISMPGKIVINLLKLMIVPLLVLSLISGLLSLNIKTTGKVGLYTILYYCLTTFLAICLGMTLVLTIRPGRKKIALNMNSDIKKVDAMESILDLFNNLFPDNIIRSTFQQVQTRFILKEVKSKIINDTYAAGSNKLNKNEEHKIDEHVSFANCPNFLGLIFFSIFFGIVLNILGKKGEMLVNLINILNDLTMKMIGFILVTIPVGIFFLILSNLLNIENLKETLETLGIFLGTVFAGIVIHMFITLPVMYLLFTRKNPYKYMFGMSRAILIAFVTDSSSATIPVTMECAEQNNKIDSRITKFVIPIGAIINMDGNGIYEAVAAIFIAQINGIQLGVLQIIRISFTSTIVAIGASSVPSAGFVMLLVVLSTAGLPLNQVGLLYTFDWILDRTRTAMNVLGDAYGCGIIHHWCRKQF